MTLIRYNARFRDFPRKTSFWETPGSPPFIFPRWWCGDARTNCCRSLTAKDFATASPGPRWWCSTNAAMSPRSKSLWSLTARSSTFSPNSYESEHSRRSHCRRRYRRLQYCLAPDDGWVQERADRRARERAGKRLHRQEHGRSPRAVFDARQHPDVVVFNSLLREV